MALRRTYTHKGFTLFEVITVMGIIAIIGGLSVSFGIDTLRAYSFHSDRDLLVAALHHARAAAVGNICQTNSEDVCTDGRPHGVHVENGKIVMYQTKTGYTARDASVDAVIDLNPSTTVTGVSDVVFSQLSGDVVTPGDIILTEPSGRISVITIGSEGQILWTN